MSEHACCRIVGARRLVLCLVAFAFAVTFSMFMPAGRAQAACTVPNSISNGQVADATAVMDNFNALNNCVNNAVSPSGLPASSGNLPVFSGPNTIASGNLSGDCTTSGTLAVTCTKSNGAPLSYFATGTDGSQLTGTISVNRFNNGTDADGIHFLRGDGVWAVPSGGGSGLWWAGHAPLATDFTPWHGATVNNVDLTLSYDANVGLILDSVNVAAGENVRFAEKAAPSHTADFTITARITPNLLPGNYNIVGQTLRETSGNISVIFGFSFGGGPFMLVRSQTGTNYIANRASEQRLPGNEPYWSRIRYVQASDTYFFDFSIDGKAWVNIYSGTRATLFGAGITPTMQGLGFYVNNGTANKKNVASCDYYVVQ